MKPSGRRTPTFRYHNLPRALVFGAAMLSLSLNNANAWAADVHPVDAPIAAAGDTIDHPWQIALAFEMRLPRRLRAKRHELAVRETALAEVQAAMNV